MKILELKGTEDTPYVKLDKEEGNFIISGRSLPEDSAEFFKDVLDWLDDYAKNPNKSTNFIFKLEYFNTASSKKILDVLSKLEDIPQIAVSWYYYEDDEDMLEAGEEFSEIIDIPFTFPIYEE